MIPRVPYDTALPDVGVGSLPKAGWSQNLTPADQNPKRLAWDDNLFTHRPARQQGEFGFPVVVTDYNGDES